MNHFQPHGAFGHVYEVLCRERCLSPLSAVCAHLQEKRLRFCTDHVSFEDWSPILNSIAQDRSLSQISVYSRHRRKNVKEKINTEEKVAKLRCGWPVLYTNYMLRCLIDAITVCARDSTSMTCVTLDGIPLTPKYLKILGHGMTECRSLKALSLTRCRIGDAGCDLVLDALQNNTSLHSLNLSACYLTSRSATFLSVFLKRRRTKLMQSIWKEAADRICDQPSSQGLHTLILNNNRKLGDIGVRMVTDVLKEDFSIKTLGLRHCGLTKNGGTAVIELLETNRVIASMDLKENDVPSNILQSAYRLLRRRQEKGERIPINKRLLHRKESIAGNKKGRKDLKKSAITMAKQRSIENDKNFQRHCMGRIPNQQGQKTTKHEKDSLSKKSLNKAHIRKGNLCKRKAKQGNRNKRRAASRSCLKPGKSNLRNLIARLSKVTGCNQSLLEELKNGEKLLVMEKTSTMKAKRDYSTLEQKMEKLTKSIRAQSRIHCSASRESLLLEYLQRIFATLETTATEKPCSPEKISKKSDDDEILQGIDKNDGSKTALTSDVASGAKRKNHNRRSIAKSPLRIRPHCPHRLRM